MHNLREIKKQQIGIKLPKHLIDDLDELKEQFSLNRADIVAEAIKSYIDYQKQQMSFEKELLERVNDIKYDKIKPLSKEEVFDGI